MKQLKIRNFELVLGKFLQVLAYQQTHDIKTMFILYFRQFQGNFLLYDISVVK